MKLLKRLKVVWHLVGTKNWYQKVDHPTFYQWIYCWRLGFKTSWKVSKIIYK